MKLDSLHLKGFIGWLFWGIAHVHFLIGLPNWAVVAFSWLWNYLTYQRGARLIVDGPDAQAATREEKEGPLPSPVVISRERNPDQARSGGSDWR